MSDKINAMLDVLASAGYSDGQIAEFTDHFHTPDEPAVLRSDSPVSEALEGYEERWAYQRSDGEWTTISGFRAKALQDQIVRILVPASPEPDKDNAVSGQTMRLTDAELEADLARTRFVLSSTLLTGEERKAWNEHEDEVRREIRLRARRHATEQEGDDGTR